jgi:DNA processing protein
MSTGCFAARTLFRLKQSCADIKTIIHTPAEKLPLNDPQRVLFRETIRTNIQPILKTIESQQIQFLLPEDPGFPQALREMEDPPFGLFLRGAPLGDRIRVAIVGTRDITPYGRRVTTFLSRELTRHGISIVSGLAFGVDLAAHEACIEAGGHTIAVLPGGVNTASVMPPSHAPIAQRFVKNQTGTLLSEYPPSAPIKAFHFLLRNRLIAAIASAIIVTEGDHKSGALVTARLGLEGGRDVLAVPGDIFSPTSRGTNALIADGARPCRNAEDVLSVLGLKNTEQAKQIAEARREIPVTPDEARLLSALSFPQSVDDLSRLLQESVAKTSATISILELKGCVLAVGPRTYVRNTG